MISLNIKKIFIYLGIILVIFVLDRISKIYILNIAESSETVEVNVNFFLNFILVWNTGIGFGIASIEANIFYHIITAIILVINFILIFFLLRAKGVSAYLLALIIGGSLGNLFDRIYYYAVPDFIDLHFGNFHWFVFNIADISISIGIIGLMVIELSKKKNV